MVPSRHSSLFAVQTVLFAKIILLCLLSTNTTFCYSRETPAALEWQQSYSSILTTNLGEEYWSGYYITQTSDGGFLASGVMLQGVYRGILKTSPDGTEQWRYVLGSNQRPVLGNFVYENDIHNYEFAGCYPSSLGVPTGLIYFMELSPDGDTVGSRYTYSSEGYTAGVPILSLTSDNNIILAAPVTLGEGQNRSVLLAKADRQGKKFWEKRFDTPVEGFLAVNAVLQTQDGGYALIGYNYAPGDSLSFIFLIRTDSSGKKLWETILHEGFQLSADFKQTADGGFIILANKYETKPNRRSIHLIKIDRDGEQQWEKLIEKAPILNGNSISIAPNGSIFIGGYTARFTTPESGIMEYKSRDFYLARTTPNGEVAWEVQYGSDSSELINYITTTDDGGLVVTGGYHDSLYIAKFSPAVATSIPESTPTGVPSLRITPNPVHETASIRYEVEKPQHLTITLVDVLGREVQIFSGFRAAGTYEVTLEASLYPPGVYFLRAQSNAGTTMQNIVVTR